MNDKIERNHLDRHAAMYLRQSTLKQVHEHRESTARQYALTARATELGWDPARVQTIDEDLARVGPARSGAAAFSASPRTSPTAGSAPSWPSRSPAWPAPPPTGTGCWTCAVWLMW